MVLRKIKRSSKSWIGYTFFVYLFILNILFIWNLYLQFDKKKTGAVDFDYSQQIMCDLVRIRNINPLVPSVH